MIVFFEGLDRNYLLLGEIIVLELFDLILLILHPENSAAIKIKRNCNFWHSELAMKFDLVFVSIDLVHVFVLDLKLNSFVGSEVHMAYRFCVGKATKITILTPYIMVME